MDLKNSSCFWYNGKNNRFQSADSKLKNSQTLYLLLLPKISKNLPQWQSS